jgi:hypothetical protein
MDSHFLSNKGRRSSTTLTPNCPSTHRPQVSSLGSRRDTRARYLQGVCSYALQQLIFKAASLQVIQQADFVVPVEIEYQWHNAYVTKRPGVDNFLKKMGEIYEIVVFTASLGKVRSVDSR